MPSSVFICYSRKDARWKDLLALQLGVLEREGRLRVWQDGLLEAGVPWRAEIDAALDEARVAILLVSAEFFNSDFIRRHELPPLLARRERVGLRVIPVIVSPCPWQEVEWLAPTQVRPADGRPLAGMRPVQARAVVSRLAVEVLRLAEEMDALHGPAPVDRRRPPGGANRVGRQAPILDLGRLPEAGPRFVGLVGREQAIERLDAAWEDPTTHVLSLVAFGGMGKSALVSAWLAAMAADGWRGAERVLDWSFYRQGAEVGTGSAEPFIRHALGAFGDRDPTGGSPYDCGVRLASLVRERRTLLILDGLEPMQHGAGPVEGKLKDPGLAALLKGLAFANPGLCLVTTRLPLTDLADLRATAPQYDLEALSVAAAIDLLRRLGVTGGEDEMRGAVGELRRDALTLNLLGNYLRRAHGGNVGRRREVDLPGGREGRRTRFPDHGGLLRFPGPYQRRPPERPMARHVLGERSLPPSLIAGQVSSGWS